MRLIMLGTGPFAVPTLRKLHHSAHDVLLVVSRPPKGRHPPPAPMGLAAEELDIPLWTPNTVNSDTSRLRLSQQNPDLLVVCDYGEILKPATLAVSRLGGINLHGSLLPKYRGAAPVQWAVLRGDTETGNTVIQMTPGLDAGPCLGVQREPIDPDETAGELEARLAGLGADLVLQIVDGLARGFATPTPQIAGQATKAPRLSKADGNIDWSQTAQQIKNRVRAMQPWPRAFTFWLRKEAKPMRIIVHRVAMAGETDLPDEIKSAAAPGTVIEAEPRMIVATGRGPIELVEVQPAGKREMPVREFLRGYPVQVGQRLGDG